jgi:hypothetical protein
VTAGPSDPAPAGDADGPQGQSTGGGPDQSGSDDTVLTLREGGRSYTNIARTLGLDGVAQANAAFNRALRRLPAGEQEASRGREMARLDALGERLRHRDDLDEAEKARRRKALERLRTALTA